MDTVIKRRWKVIEDCFWTELEGWPYFRREDNVDIFGFYKDKRPSILFAENPEDLPLGRTSRIFEVYLENSGVYLNYLFRKNPEFERSFVTLTEDKGVPLKMVWSMSEKSVMANMDVGGMSSSQQEKLFKYGGKYDEGKVLKCFLDKEKLLEWAKQTLEELCRKEFKLFVEKWKEYIVETKQEIFEVVEICCKKTFSKTRIREIAMEVEKVSTPL